MKWRKRKLVKQYMTCLLKDNKINRKTMEIENDLLPNMKEEY